MTDAKRTGKCIFTTDATAHAQIHTLVSRQLLGRFRSNLVRGSTIGPALGAGMCSDVIDPTAHAHIDSFVSRQLPGRLRLNLVSVISDRCQTHWEMHFYDEHYCACANS